MVMANDTPLSGSEQPAVIEAQVDWLTAGFSEGERADRAAAWAFSRAQREKREGAREAPFRLLGFEGYAVGRIRYGTRGADAIIQLSGQLAEDYLGDVLPNADRVSRLDLAVTVRLPRPDPFLGESTYAQACNYRAEHPSAARPWIVQDDDGGCTAYVGDRASDRFLRVYNKEAEALGRADAKEASHYKRCWRYELECKGTTALPVARAAHSAVDRRSFLQQQLHNYCLRHGIEPVFRPDDNGLLVPGFRRRSDAESRLTWLRKSVNPAILSLLEVRDREDILDALGLGEEPRADGYLGGV
jgi:DNA relaxase NicK